MLKMVRFAMFLVHDHAENVLELHFEPFESLSKGHLRGSGAPGP